MAVVCSRRAFLWAVPAIATAQIASERKTYRDPLTEFEVLRLTDPEVSNCYLPSAPLRAVSARDNLLLYCSDRSGSMQAYRMALPSGESRQITTAENLDYRTASLLPDDRSVCYCDGDDILIAGARSRVVYSPAGDWKRAQGFSVSEDGNHAINVERQSAEWQVRLVSLAKGTALTVAQTTSPVLFTAARPTRAGLLYGGTDSLAVVNYDGSQNRKLRIGAGSVVSALWSADGRSIFYVVAGERGNEMREHIPDTNEDKLVARTTQFVSFARSANSSVFAGVSGSAAAPHVLILVRSVRREMTVAEHKASDPAKVAVQFSSSSQRIFYSTDRQGRSAIFTMNLERFIEKTESKDRLLEPG